MKQFLLSSTPPRLSPLPSISPPFSSSLLPAAAASLSSPSAYPCTSRFSLPSGSFSCTSKGLSLGLIMALLPENSSFPPPPARVVTIRYPDLQDKSVDISQELEAGFGPSGFGIIAVSGVPNYTILRQNLLTLSDRLAALPEEVKEQLEDPASRYSFGWSHGKETLESGQPDVLKGSFYANPLLDVPTSNADHIQRYPSYCRPNLWPKSELPDLEPAFKDLGRLIVDVGLLLAYHCDKYVFLKSSRGQKGSLEKMLQRSLCHKGRLLHYFAPSSSEHTRRLETISSWCGWHTDHGSLTGLTCAMYMKDGKEVVCSDKEAGLYVQTRTKEIFKVIYKEDEIAYQMGEATELFSSRLFHATPHCVRAAQGNTAIGVVRNTFAVFMQPHWDEPLNNLQLNSGHDHKIESNDLNFGDFSENTLSKYYGS